MKKRLENEKWRDGHYHIESFNFTWQDRLRLLFGCKIHVRSEIVSQWKFGETASYMTFEIEKLLPKLRKTGREIEA